MKSLRYIFIILILFVFGLNTQARVITYPVQVNTQLIPPYTPYVPQYYSGSFPKLKVTIVNNDFQSPPLRVFLRMKIQSSTFSMYTPEYKQIFFATLDPGMPLQIASQDLAVFFRAENFQCTGYKSTFLNSQQFPDDFYTFHFEVYDAATGQLLSSPTMGRAMARIMLGEPPVPQLPEKGKTISETPFPNIMFNWRPALNLPAGYNVEYEFSMAEIYDKKVNPEAAFTYSRILYTERTPAPSFIHGLSQPMLIPGMRYAWRVRAIAKQGIEETSVIKNNGFSQVFWFDYAADCNIVTTLGAIYENNKVNITWQDVNAMNYTVEYRKKNSSKWYTGEITQPELCTVYNLKNDTEYEYRVGSRCVINDAYQYSAIKGIKIPSKEDLQQERQRNCGIMPDTKITNKTPIEQLIPGQPVLAGDFPVFISKVTGSGRFSGEGYVGIPYIGNLKVAVTFKDIVVNTDSRLISGYFETKYDAVNNMTVDIDQALTGGKGVGDVRTGEEKAAYTVDYNINPDIKVLPVKADGTKDEIAEGGNYTLTKGENEKYVFIITDAEGKEHQMEIEDIPATILDKDGNSYQINENGNIEIINIQHDIDEVIVQGLSDSYEIVINEEAEKITTDRKLKLVYGQQKLNLKLQKNNGDSIKIGNIQWQITEKKTAVSDSILKKEITLADNDIKVVIYEKYLDDKQKEKKAKIAELVFVIKQSPYIKLSTLSSYNGEFGFDDGEDFKENSVPKTAMQYDTIHIADKQNKTKVLYVPWLTLLRSQTTELQVKLSKEIEGDSIYVETSDNRIVMKYDKVQKRFFVTNNTLNNTFDNPVYISFCRDDKYGLQKNMLIGKVAVVGRPLFSRTIPVQIIYFAKDTTRIGNSVNSERLENLLNSNSLNQSFVHFDVLSNIIKIKNTLNDAVKTEALNAYNAIKTICENKGMSIKYSHNPDTIFIIQTDLEFKSTKEVGGSSVTETKGGGVSYDKNKNVHNNLAIMWIVSGDKEKMIIHEIGHTLGLRDTFNDNVLGNPAKTFSRHNYMDYDIIRKMFFKTQIQTIFDNLKKGEK